MTADKQDYEIACQQNLAVNSCVLCLKGQCQQEGEKRIINEKFHLKALIVFFQENHASTNFLESSSNLVHYVDVYYRHQCSQLTAGEVEQAIETVDQAE